MGPMVKHISIFLLILTSVSLNVSGSGTFEASIQLSPQEILIGQPADLQLSVTTPATGLLIWPAKEELEAHNFEVLRFGMIDTLEHIDGNIHMRQTHRITAWEGGYIPIPPLEFTFISETDTVTFESRAQLFEVKGVEVDMQEAYRDIKPLFGFPRTFREILPYIFAIIGILLIMLLLIIYLKSRKKPAEEPTIWEKPEVPAHIAAISSLETLRRKELWQRGEIKAFHSELTTILRKYLYKRYQLDALEMTTGEILKYLPGHIEEKELINEFKLIFELADMVKFAKFKPEEQEHEQMLEKALSFVKNTAVIVNNKE